MKKIVIATRNPGKLDEFKKTLSGWGGFELYSLRDFGDLDPEETGTTFGENAVIKAVTTFRETGLPALGDDAGLEIDVLGGEPGVKSHRWIDGVNEAADDELIDYTLARLAGVPYENRTARLKLVLAYFDGTALSLSTAAIEGIIIEERPKKNEPGFPFRGLLFVPEYGKLYGEFTEEEHNTINHRRRALNALRRSI
ncbi:non-canonical purine NTP pyrophosphatase, partial [bacterium]|nr:non-canonical purine NTP pyrophosphatase [bacterium]